MQKTLTFPTHSREALYDITGPIAGVVADSGFRAGLCAVYAQGATAAIMIQENWDESVQNDVVTLLRQLAPQGVWEHDRHDGNADSHLKAGLVGPSETIPVIDGRLGLSTWQSIFFCEFDGPRSERSVVVTVLASE
jgi:secondary thiamine-phosphate synthase enzyme